MRIALLFDLANPEMGGSYTFNKMIYDEIHQSRSSRDHDFLLLYNKNNTTGANPDVPLPTIPQYRYAYFKSLIFQLFNLRFLRDGIDLDFCRAAALNKIFSRNKIDVVWAVQPLGVPVIPPYITTSWDIAHKITPYLPEFSGLGNQTKKRDNVAKKVFAKAYKIVVGTSVGKDELMNVYGINPERLLVNPLPQEAIPEKINRQRTTSTIIYPANFWPHKNHAILIKAIKLLVDQSDINVNLILTGSDRGAYGSLKSLVENLSLDDHVDFRGFVTTDELHNLYASSSLLVFPTLIGPDNLPPLEALARGCQITVSDIPGAREQFGKFSTYFDPYDVRSVAGAIQEALKKDSSSFSDEEIYSFLDDRNPKKYVDLVIKEIEKLSHLTEFN